MRRLAIFCLYDKDGIVDTYREEVLKELLTIVEDLIIVVNGTLQYGQEKILEQYTNQIYYRENVGFDAGAYKDCILNYIGINKLYLYDQLILCNDTFFGPFIPMKKIFIQMESENLDFWGLDYFEGEILDYIGSYFLVINSSILHSGDLIEYFIKNVNSQEKNILNVYSTFEVGLFRFFVSNGYRFGTFAKTNNVNVYINPDICMNKYQYPILKKRCFAPEYSKYGNYQNALSFIHKYSEYNIKHIRDNVKRAYGLEININEIEKKDFIVRYFIGDKIILTINELRDFWNDNEEIYIYGIGIYARKLYYLSQELDLRKPIGFLVSDINRINEKIVFEVPIYQYNQINGIKKIVLGLDKGNTEEVLKKISEKDRVLTLWKMF